MNIQNAETGQSGSSRLVLSGEYAFAEAAGLRQAMIEALDACPGELLLDLGAVERGDLTFFQLLFALASQARLDGKRVLLDAPLSEPLRRAAGELGFAHRDMEQAFLHGDAR